MLTRPRRSVKTSMGKSVIISMGEDGPSVEPPDAEGRWVCELCLRRVLSRSVCGFSVNWGLYWEVEAERPREGALKDCGSFFSASLSWYFMRMKDAMYATIAVKETVCQVMPRTRTRTHKIRDIAKANSRMKEDRPVLSIRTHARSGHGTRIYCRKMYNIRS